MLKWTIFRRIVFVACLLGSIGANADEASSPSNFEMLHEAASSVADQLVESLKSSQGMNDGRTPFALRSVGSPDGTFLVESALSKVLAAAGMTVRTRADSTGLVLEFEVIDLGLSYTRVRRHAWLGEKVVDREARARIFARLVDEDRGEILWAEQKDAKLIDEVRHADLASLEENTAPAYLKAELPPRRWNKLVEPIVVTGIVVGLIVLFFSNQDASN